MQFFRHQAKPKEKILRLYPLVCWHIGSPQSDTEFIEGIVERIRNDEDARWIVLGDLGDCVTKQSKGDVFSQTMSVEEQLKENLRLLNPILDKGLFGVAGNHGQRIYQETGLSYDMALCNMLGIPYFGQAVLMRLEVYKVFYDVYVRHGLSSGATMGHKVKRAYDAGIYIQADAVITAHSHVAMELEPETFAFIGRVDAKEPIRWRQQRYYVAGSAYDSRTGYAEEKGYKPFLPAHVVIGFRGRKSYPDQRKRKDHNYRKQIFEVIRKEV